jgi:ABC-type sugar transport system ATPase subunit
MSVLEMRNIKRVYDDAAVLDIDKFTLEKSERVALVGPNGSGKTTLLNIAALLDTPDSGEMAIQNKSVDFKKPDEHRVNVTLVAQEPFFFAGSLQRNMAFGLNGSRLDLVVEYLQMLGIGELKKRSPRTFSSGELKRAAIARALVHKTPILLLDEPFANVDAQSNEILQRVIGNLPENQSVIFTTHELSRAHDIADRIVTLQDGKISPWTPENLYRLKARPIEDGWEFLSDSGLRIYYAGELNSAQGKTNNERIYTVSINSNQVLLSKDEIASSAQNSFKGVIRRIEAIGKNLVGFTIECSDGFSIKASVTSRTVKEFNCTVGDDVWAHFKSAAIHVFD